MNKILFRIWLSVIISEQNGSKEYVLRYKFTATYLKTGNIGINENDIPNTSVILYPNPAHNILYIETGNPNIISEVKIYSMHGALLFRMKGNQIDISFLASGIYVVEIEGVTQKIVKL